MKWLLLVALCLSLLYSPTAYSYGTSQSSSSDPWAGNAWVKKWQKRDHNLKEATRVAAWVFKVSPQWMADCNASEGGNVSRSKLARSLRLGYGPGWNNAGSYAFGPWQYMLGAKPPQHQGEWGTFGSYDDSAFRASKRLGHAVPYRFKRPDSFVGQAITTAYMFSIGQSGHWMGAGC